MHATQKVKTDLQRPDFTMINNSSGLSLHKEMYIMPVAWADKYHDSQTEVVFQVSTKYSIYKTFYAGYTQISYWQAYNSDESAPFRETNYNPELFYRMPSNTYLGPLGFDFGFEHSMLTEDKSHHFRVFDEAVVEQDIFRRYYQNEELLAFYQAYERGHNEALITACLQQHPVTKENIKAMKTMMLTYQYLPDNDFEQRNKEWFDRTLDKLKALL